MFRLIMVAITTTTTTRKEKKKKRKRHLEAEVKDLHQSAGEKRHKKNKTFPRTKALNRTKTSKEARAVYSTQRAVKPVHSAGASRRLLDFTYSD